MASASSYPRDIPRLTRGAVTLRAPVPGDEEGVVEQCRDPLSRQWTTVPLEYTRRDAQHYLHDVIPDGWRSGESWTFVVEVADEGGTPRYAGTISLRDQGDRRAEVAYGAHPWVRGRGALETAVRLLLEWGFSECGVRTVVWWAHTGNWSSRKLAWRLGFSVGGTVEQWLVQRGDLKDAWVGVLLAGAPMAPRSPWYDVPRLVSDPVVLRPNHAADVTRIVEACRDPESRRWLGVLPSPYTAAHAEEFLESRTEAHATGTGVTWAVADPASDLLIGEINLFDITSGVDAELGYWIHPDARGRGSATAATRLVLRHAFVAAADGGLGLQRVRALAAEGNTASRRVLEKAGMVHQGRERRAVLVAGGVRADAAVYDVLADELR